MARVGPDEYSPALAELRPKLGNGSIVVRAPEELLEEEHGRDYLVWELRGNRICVEQQGVEGPPHRGISAVVAVDEDALAYRVFRADPVEGSGPCPFIPDGARADPAGDG